MKILKNKKFVRKCTIVFAGTLLLTTVVQAASLTKKIDATFKNIKVFYNNQQKTVAQEPFIYGGNVFLPVRAVAELVDKNVDWNSATNSVYVSDKGGAVSNTLVQQLESEIAAKNFEIAKISAEKSALESKVKELEENKKTDTSSGDLKDTLRHLEDEFDSEHSIDWEFSLKETSSRINVEVSFDSRADGNRWDKLSKRQIDTLFEDICYEIRKDHKNIAINGKVIDSRTDKTVGTFTYSKSNSFSYTDNSSISFSDLEKDLKRIYKNINSKILVDDLKIKGDEDNITFTVIVDLTRDVSRDWEDLAEKEMYTSSRVIRDFMTDIEEEIERDYKHATIEGYIENYARNNEVIASYERGRLTIPR